METHRVRTLVRILVAIGIGLFVLRGSCTAQNFELLHTFTYSLGAPQAPLIEAPDGKIYGTTRGGGDFQSGSIYVLSPLGGGTYGFAELHSFRGIDGTSPKGALALGPDGTLYGVCGAGGAGDYGTVWSLDPSGALTILHNFAFDEGTHPNGGLVIGPDSAFYGVCRDGGAFVFGTIYRVDAAGTFATIHDFDLSGAGFQPTGELASSAEGFYGVTENGGKFGGGTVYRLDTSGVLTTLHDFSGADGSFPRCTPLLDSGMLFGTTFNGGDSSGGTAFAIDLANGDFRTLHSFVSVNGTQPMGVLAASGGFLHGTANAGGMHGTGTVFRIDEATGNTIALHDFGTGEGGAFPESGLIQAAGGDFFGTTLVGDPDGFGTVFRTDLLGNTSAVHRFSSPSGRQPLGIILASTGDLYGTTAVGGAWEGGVAYRLSPDLTFQTLHEFSAGDGYGPNSPLLERADGFFYGTTQGGGGAGNGTIFRVDSDGNFEKLHDLAILEGRFSGAGLVAASDGNFYGTTTSGGIPGLGNVFQMDSLFQVQSIHDFFTSEGVAPLSTLVEGPGAKLYGMTSTTAFRIDFAGGLEILHTFDAATEGAQPLSGLRLAQDGFFYGLLNLNGPEGFGSVFQMSASGDTEVLHAFLGGTDGGFPFGGLIEDDLGHLIGGAGGGNFGGGIVFRVSPLGAMERLHDFQSTDGAAPRGSLARSSAGDLYGVTSSGGAANSGVIYHISPTPLPTTIEGSEPSSGRSSGGGSVRIRGTHLPPDPVVSIGGLPAGSPLALDASSVLVISPALPVGTLQDIVVSSATLAEVPAAVLSKGWFVDFADVARTHAFHDFIEVIFRAAITAGCDPGVYCPDAEVTREQMAVFLLKAEHGSDYDPPDCTGVFADVLCTPSVGFPDWIERLHAEGITGGCVANPLQYCPTRAVTRAEMAVFLLKTKHGTSYTPPACAGLFADVPCPATPEFPFSDWIEQLFAEQVTGGCATGPLRYCPDAANLRGEMAVFLTKTFALSNIRVNAGQGPALPTVRGSAFGGRLLTKTFLQ